MFASEDYSAFEAKSEDDDIVVECVVKKPQIEVVDLSSDDEDQVGDGRRLISSAYVKGMSNKKASICLQIFWINLSYCLKNATVNYFQFLVYIAATPRRIENETFEAN